MGYKIKRMHKDAFVRTAAMEDKHVREQGHFKSKNVLGLWDYRELFF